MAKVERSDWERVGLTMRAIGDSGDALLRCIFVYSCCCSKSFGESTPSREAYRAHSSPNSPISPRLVRPPSLEGTARHIAHQTFWHKASERCHNAFQQLAQGTLWLTNTPIESTLALKPSCWQLFQILWGTSQPC